MLISTVDCCLGNLQVYRLAETAQVCPLKLGLPLANDVTRDSGTVS
jgi:hypothetical protein